MGKSLHICLVGDGMIGKTCILNKYLHNTFYENNSPTIFETTEKIINVKGVDYNITISDTSGQEEYADLRQLPYVKANVFIICFALDKKVSFENVKEHWYLEIKRFCKNYPMILVGTKSDLPHAVTEKDAEKMRKKIKAKKYIHCSSKTGASINDIFEFAVDAYEQNERKGVKSSCKIG